MTELIAAFCSRHQAVDCLVRLRELNAGARLVGTPKEAGAGDGLSVSFSARGAARARAVIKVARYSQLCCIVKMRFKHGKYYFKRT